MANAGDVRPEEAFDWEELLLYIEERQVIPVVGKELLVLPIDGEQVPLERHLATRLAEAFDIPRESLSERYDLTEVALRVEGRGARRKLYPKVLAAMKELTGRDPLPIPEPLAQLASITDFQLFISATFDPFLKAALDRVRFGGEDRTDHLAYSVKNELKDLPAGLADLDGPLVYQIFGELSSVVGDYAVTDEDALEFLHQLQSDRRPAVLFDELKDHHLLFLGCGFPDWLGLSFIRTITNHPLRESRDTAEVIADLANRDNDRFRRLMEDCDAYLFPSGDPREFVRTLTERWKERQPDSEPQAAAPSSAAAPAAGSRMEPGAIFISYASEDRPAAENLKKALEDGGLEVWLDRKDLKSGDAWKPALRKNVGRCSLFLPLLSQTSAKRMEGVFREEWSWAIERSQGIAEEVPFIQPIVVDDLPDRSRGIPDRFWEVQTSRFDAARATAEFVERAKRAVREYRLGSR